jgi:CheY-like chemotaxis protein/HPt (histidine-containing phosphotransfer) domain-containing protein
VLINLIGNAIKFTEKVAVVVKASTTREDDSTVTLNISIKDTGVGIDSQGRLQLFRPFSQMDGSTTRKYGGTGLGLAISMELVALMGGTLDCKSSPGKGTEFFFSLPMEKDTGIQKRSFLLKSDELKGLNVLIIDDYPINVEILERQVAGFGMVYDSVLRGSAGLEKLRSAQQKNVPFDLVLLDMDMPDMDGLEVIRRIKADPTLNKTPIVMLTSVWMRGDVHAPKPDAYLTKPVKQSDLQDTLLKVLGHLMDEPVEPASQHCLSQGEQQIDCHVLVAEDNLTNQKVTMAMLMIFGCRVSLADNGRQAVEMFLKDAPDLVLMDCQMPEMDGYQATIKIRRHEKKLTTKTPIVALTAHAMAGSREKCLAAGMDDYLSKPFTMKVLQAKLERWFLSDERMGVQHEHGPDTQVSSLSQEGPAAEDSLGDETDSTVIDPQAIQTIKALQMEGEPNILSSVVKAYLTGVESKISQLRDTVSCPTLMDLQAFAHSLKSSSANVGAVVLSEICKSLEMACRNNTLDDSDPYIKAIECEFVKVKSALEEEIRRL